MAKRNSFSTPCKIALQYLLGESLKHMPLVTRTMQHARRRLEKPTLLNIILKGGFVDEPAIFHRI